MEAKKFTEAESLQLISQMIASTHEKLEQGGGRIFLRWGYVSVAVAIGVLVAATITESPYVSWGWFAIPIIGYSCKLFLDKNRPKPVVTYIDRSLGVVWGVLGVALCVSPIVMSMVGAYGSILCIEMLLVSIGVVISGAVMRFRPLVVGGIIGMIVAYIFPFMPKMGLSMWEYNILTVSLFIVVFVATMIVPGHILNHKGRKNV